MYTNLQFKNFRGSVVIAAITALLLVFSVFFPISAYAEQPLISNGKIQTKKNNFNVVVLGDSLAAGYQKGFDTTSVPYGFGEIVYEQAMFQGNRATYANYGVLGLRSKGLLNWLNAAEKQQFITANDVQQGLNDPRVDTLIGDTKALYESITGADLIVLAIGGNDFLNILAGLDLTKSVSSMSADEKNALVTQLQTSTDEYKKNLTAILTTIQSLNPDVIIASQNQYLPLPKLTINGQVFYGDVPKDLAELLIGAQTNLNKEFDTVIEVFKKSGLHIDYIDAASVIDGNAIGLTDIVTLDVHPNATGYQKLGEAYSNLLWGEFKTAAARKAGDPLSVIVNGQDVVSNYPTKVINGRTYLVLRDITTAVGAELSWSNKTQTATVQLNNRTVELKVGSNTYVVNGKSYPLDAPVFLETIGKENKTYVPIAALSSGLDLFVQYWGKQKLVFVNN
ncbi:stalk domain-containing protein [Paenibacillus endoradicis]|uniref:stalk domain-containing protein n=1 Tax=Paenibacillus endoradicis TaxID=2972487 RepID=UPI00215957EE|nr:stalk domain-containing protein [Paenibacillus endoradicis]MCR8659534.1 stalk domain-containing protein [Paenibacillus endoradicis]